MSATDTKRIKVQYRQFSTDPDFPVFCFTSENRPISPIFDLNNGKEIRYMHLHNCIEIACVASDGGEFYVPGGTHPLKKDDIVIVMPYCTHILREQHSGPYCDYLYFDPVAFLRNFCPDALPVCEIFESKNAPASTILRDESAAVLSKRVHEILNELKNSRDHSRFCIKGLLLALIIELARIPGQDLPMERSSNSVAPIIPAVQYINDHFRDFISIEELQNLCHLSGTHFRRLFNSIIGYSPLEYIHNLRISRACDLLLSSDASILNIALSVGYDSISSFNRQFMKIMSMPPSKWRTLRLNGRNKYMPASIYDTQKG